KGGCHPETLFRGYAKSMFKWGVFVSQGFEKYPLTANSQLVQNTNIEKTAHRNYGGPPFLCQIGSYKLRFAGNVYTNQFIEL
ncbi:MAG: hypothetical protein P8Y96_11785, partial [Desulfuromonadales bacterium]